MPASLPPQQFRRKSRVETWTNFSVLRHGRFQGVLVTSKNSGTHWLKYMLAVALAHQHGIAPPAYFSEAGVRPYIGGPKDTPAFPELPRLAFCHSIPHRLADWGWARAFAGLPPYVLALRHPMQALASHYAKWAEQYGVSWEVYLEGDPSGRRYRCDVWWLARFWNRWGELTQAMPGRVLTVTYEATERDARAVLSAISDYWHLGLGAAALDAALAAGTKGAMALRIDPNGEPNVLQNRQEAPAALFRDAAYTIYADRVRSAFRYDLGYDLLTPPAHPVPSAT